MKLGALLLIWGRWKLRPHCGHAAFHEPISLLSWLINNHHTLAKSHFCSHGCGCWWSCSGRQGICRHSLVQIPVLYLQLNYPTGSGRWRVSDLCYHWFTVNDNSPDFSIWLTFADFIMLTSRQWGSVTFPSDQLYTPNTQIRSTCNTAMPEETSILLSDSSDPLARIITMTS